MVIGFSAAASRLLDGVIAAIERVINDKIEGIPFIETLNASDGLAGIAFFLHMASRYGFEVPQWRPILARATQNVKAARCRELIEGTSALAGPASVFYVAALLEPDPTSQYPPWNSLVSSSGVKEDRAEFYFGSAGLLSACACIAQRYGAFHTAPLIDALSVEVERTLRRTLSTVNEQTFLGMAHGIAGLCYSLLLSARAAHSRIDDELLTCALDFLAQQAICAPTGGLQWPMRFGGSGGDATWCNGSAGFVFLWIEAALRYGRGLYGELTENAMVNTVKEHDPQLPGLCCGYAGRAYAALQTYQLTQNERWLTAAKSLSEQACLASLKVSLPLTSLFRGGLGAACAALALHDPAHSSMPLVGLSL